MNSTSADGSADGARGTFRRRLPIGAEVRPEGGVHFRVWAPRRTRVDVVLEGGAVTQPLAAEAGGDGYFSGWVGEARVGQTYHFLLDGGDYAYPDPASRFQPRGVHGPSQIVDCSDYEWGDGDWKGISLKGQVMSEIHIGTFSPEGTYAGAAKKLPLLKEIGITTVELMPLGEFAGNYGWGYDGVALYAPTRNYGTPDDLRRFIDRAHGLGMGVILDVVYNHFGPEGNYASAFSEDYFSRKHQGEWGTPINFDDGHAGPVREFFIENAGYWIEEFHFDGLRLDAVQAIIDDTPDHVLAALTRRARERAGDRKVVVVSEDELQLAHRFTPVDVGGYGLDGAWNDDFHHVCRVAATGQAESYYSAYQGSPQEMISAIKRGYLYQGQWSAAGDKFRGSSTRGCAAWQFITFLQNHDQIANEPTARRLGQLTSAGRYRALTALWLLAPGTPLFFQGQEWGASAPFHYFVDHPTDLADLVREGRWEEMRRFGRAIGHERVRPLFDPTDPRVFEVCRLDWAEREAESHAEILLMHQDLLKLRREESVFAAQDAEAIEGAVLGPESFVLRYFGESGDDRLVLVNMGRDLVLGAQAEPLLAPPRLRGWELLWSSDSPLYGGSGTVAIDVKNWLLPAHATMVLAGVPLPVRSAEEVEEE